MIPSAMALTREDFFERRDLDLTVISPVHIGTREGSLTALEFAVHEGRTYVIDEERLGLFLKDHGLVDSFVEAARRGPIRLKEFIGSKKGGSLLPALEEISRYSIPGGLDRIQEFRPFVRDGKGQIYLPGTAIKGVFRTALLYKMLSDDPRRRDQIRKSAERDLPRIEGREKESVKKRFSMKWLQTPLLESFSLANAREGPNADILRCLKVSDAYPVSGCETRVIKIGFLSKRSDSSFYWSKKKRGASSTDQDLEIWVESLVGGTFTTSLVWDKLLFERFRRENPKQIWPAEGIDGLLSMLFKMSKDVIQHERGFFEKRGTAQHRGPGRNPTDASRGLALFYNSLPEDAMRIGFGSGMLSTTVNLGFPNELRQKIRDACGHPRPNDPAPKSRRVWEAGNGQWRPMGWVMVRPPDMGKHENKGLHFGAGLRQADNEAAVRSPSGGQAVPSKERPARPLGRTQVHFSVGHQADEKLGLADLKKQVDLIQPNDKFGLERTVKAIERLDNAEEQRSAAEYLKRKLEKANSWRKNPKRQDIEMFLSDDIEDN